MILIAGNGRNVGKTTFATGLIRHFAQSKTVIGLKVSPHIHAINEDLKLISKTPYFVVAEELGRNGKDSSLFLQAGAKRVFLIMAEDLFLAQAFSIIAGQLKHGIVIAESGGLRDLLTPGIFFFVRKPEDPFVKEHYLKYKPLIVKNENFRIDFDINRLSFNNRRFTITNPEG